MKYKFAEKPIVSSQEIINDMNRLMFGDINLLSDSEKIDREVLLKEEEEYQERLNKIRPNPEIQKILEKSWFRSTPNYFDYHGNPISLMMWSYSCEFGDKHIGQDVIGPYLISTVWLGLNHAYFNGMLIFETMIFSKNDSDDSNPYKNYMERYATLEEAKEGHKLACEMVRSGKMPEDEG